MPKRDLVSRDLHSIDLCLIRDRQALTLEAEKAQKTGAMSASILVNVDILRLCFPGTMLFLPLFGVHSMCFEAPDVESRS